MKQILVQKNEAGQRLDKLLKKYLNLAPSSFIYKMLRKKNIKLNGKKASGNEIVNLQDLVEIYLSDDTFAKFSSLSLNQESTPARNTTSIYQGIAPLKKSQILYEDEHICLINKPQGILSQKAVREDISINEQYVSYLLSSSQITEEELQTFHPSVCNRLDRNTSGIVIAGKSLAGLQEMSRLLQTRDLHKYYWCVVKGILSEKQRIEGYLVKDEKKNQVFISDTRQEDSKPIVTEYKPLGHGDGYTLLEVLLVTGRTHQIRAHLSSIGHPIVGDRKYGDLKTNDFAWKTFGIKDQLLHARRIEFPEMKAEFSNLSGRSFKAEVPAAFRCYMEGVIPCQPGIPED